jgi:hypothetical protein
VVLREAKDKCGTGGLMFGLTALNTKKRFEDNKRKRAQCIYITQMVTLFKGDYKDNK